MTRDEPLHCGVCGERFRYSSALIRHERACLEAARERAKEAKEKANAG